MAADAISRNPTVGDEQAKDKSPAGSSEHVFRAALANDPQSWEKAFAANRQAETDRSTAGIGSDFPKVEVNDAFSTKSSVATLTRDKIQSNYQPSNTESLAETVRASLDSSKITDRVNVNDHSKPYDLDKSRSDYLSAIKGHVNSDTFEQIKNALPAMEKHDRSQRPEKGDGTEKVPRYVNREEQLAKFYDAQAYFASNAHRAMAQDGQPILTESWQLGEYLEDAVNIGRDPMFRSNQEGPTCALKTQNRIGQLYNIGGEAEQFNKAFFEGKISLTDPENNEAFTTRVNTTNFRPDDNDNKDWLGGAGGQGTYGKALTAIYGQGGVAFTDRDECRARGQEWKDHYSFDFVPAVRQDDTGIRIGVRLQPGEKLDGFMYGHKVGTERVGNQERKVLLDAQTNKPVMDPEMNQFTAGRNLQAFVGNVLEDPNFGKDNTFYPAQAGENLKWATSIHNGKELLAKAQENKDRGRNCAFFFNDTRNFVNTGGRFAGAGGGHAVGLVLNDNHSGELPSFKFLNQWNGQYNYSNLNADTAVAMMQIPGRGMSGSGVPGLIRYPEGASIVSDNSRSLKYMGNDNTDDKQAKKTDDKEYLARLEREKAQEKEAEAEQKQKDSTALAQKVQQQRKVDDTRTQLAALEQRLNGLSGPQAAELKQLQQQLLRGLQT